MARWSWRVAPALFLLGMVVPAPGQEGGLYPLNVGLKRFYKLQRRDTITLNLPGGKQTLPFEASGDAIETVAGRDETLFGAPVTVVERRSNESSAQGAARTTTLISYVQSRPDGIFLAGLKANAPDGTAGELHRYAAPLPWLKLPLQPATSWSVGTLKLDAIDALTSAEVGSPEDVTVPAGTYRNCPRVVYRHTRLSGQAAFRGGTGRVESGEGRTTVWLAPGIGPVREATELRSVYVIRPGGAQGGEIRADVTSQRIRELTRVEGIGS